MHLARAFVFVALAGCGGAGGPAPAPSSPEPSRTQAPVAAASPAGSSPGLRLPPPKKKAPGLQTDCDALIRVINKRVVEAKAIDPRTPDGMNAFADVYDGLAGELGGLSPTTPTITTLRDEYTRLCVDVSAAARAAAVRRKDAKARFDEAVKTETDLTKRINDACQRTDRGEGSAPPPG